jgi:Mrp family chromosome partitioning ATPase
VTVTPLTVPFDIVVVDPDLLWRVDAMNAFDGVMVKDMVTVLGATDELTPGHPAVVLLGPAGSVESDDQMPVLRSMFPEVRVISVADARQAATPPGWSSDHPAAGDRPGGHLILVPDADADAEGDGDGDGDPGRDELVDRVAPRRSGPAPWFDRMLPAATPMDTIVAVTLEELAVARDQAAAESGQAAARPRLVLVTGAKAGEGTTTLAVNLAAAATRAGAKVVLVETDPILGDLTLMLGLPGTVDAMVTHPTTGIRVQVLPTAEDPFEVVDARVLTETIAALQTGRTRGGPVDLVILDAPATVVRRTGVAGLADRVLITCSARLQNVKNARVLVDELGVIASEVVLNRTGRHGLAEEKIESLIGAPIVAELPDTGDLEPARFDTVPGILGERSDYVRALASLVTGILAGRASTGGRRPPAAPRYLPSAPLPDAELPRPPGAPQG